MTRTPTDYSKSMIYKLCCKDPTIEDIYVGSTTNFIKRKYNHKNACVNEKNKYYTCYKYQFIRDNGGFNNWDMILIKEYSTDTKRNLEMEERRVIEELKPTLNKTFPYISLEEKKEYQQQYGIQYREENKEKIAEKRKQYYKQYYEDNKEKILKEQQEKVVCDKCGIIISKHHLKRHQKRNICINYN